MDWRMKSAAVLPCLNEEATIGRLVEAVRAHVGLVIVVDDGSTDGTSVKSRAAGAEVIRNERSFGKGAALQAGWVQARTLGFTWALTLDGDGQHSPEDIPKFFECAQRS